MLTPPGGLAVTAHAVRVRIRAGLSELCSPRAPMGRENLIETRGAIREAGR